MSERGKACTQLSGHYSQLHPRSSLGERNEMPIDALYRELNKPSATPQATVEAITVAVRGLLADGHGGRAPAGSHRRYASIYRRAANSTLRSSTKRARRRGDQ